MGQWYVLYLCVVTKFSDMGAYVTGSIFGRHLLIPHISPKKTWEGFAGALAFSTAGSFGVRALMPHPLGVLTSRDALVLGIGLGVRGGGRRSGGVDHQALHRVRKTPATCCRASAARSI